MPPNLRPPRTPEQIAELFELSPEVVERLKRWVAEHVKLDKIAERRRQKKSAATKSSGVTASRARKTLARKPSVKDQRRCG